MNSDVLMRLVCLERNSSFEARWFHGLFFHSLHAHFATRVCLHDGRIWMSHRIVSFLSVHIMTITAACGLRKSACHPIHMAKHSCRMNKTRGPSFLRKVPQNMEHRHRRAGVYKISERDIESQAQETSCRHLTGVAHDAVACKAVDEFFPLRMKGYSNQPIEHYPGDVYKKHTKVS